MVPSQKAFAASALFVLLLDQMSSVSNTHHAWLAYAELFRVGIHTDKPLSVSFVSSSLFLLHRSMHEALVALALPQPGLRCTWPPLPPLC